MAASLGQMILVENVGNKMMYDADKPPEQTPERFIKFVDSFNSPWVGMYYDIGNHWRYGQPGDWIRQVNSREVSTVADWKRAMLQARKAGRLEILVVDATGVGAAVVDLLREKGIELGPKEPRPVTAALIASAARVTPGLVGTPSVVNPEPAWTRNASA